MRGRSNGTARVSTGTSGVVCADTEAGEATAPQAHSSPWLDRLRISGPATSPREAAEAKKALREGVDLLRAEGRPAASLQAVVWRLLQDASETLSRLDDPDSKWRCRLGSKWPPILHTAQEWNEAETQRQAVLNEEKWKIPVPRFRITDPGAVSRMMIVLDWLKYVKGRNVKRDKLIALSLSRVGLKQTRRMLVAEGIIPYDYSDSAFFMVKAKVVRHIACGLEPISY